MYVVYSMLYMRFAHFRLLYVLQRAQYGCYYSDNSSYACALALFISVFVLVPTWMST